MEKTSRSTGKKNRLLAVLNKTAAKKAAPNKTKEISQNPIPNSKAWNPCSPKITVKTVPISKPKVSQNEEAERRKRMKTISNEQLRKSKNWKRSWKTPRALACLSRKDRDWETRYQPNNRALRRKKKWLRSTTWLKIKTTKCKYSLMISYLKSCRIIRKSFSRLLTTSRTSGQHPGKMIRMKERVTSARKPKAATSWTPSKQFWTKHLLPTNKSLRNSCQTTAKKATETSARTILLYLII